MKVLQLASNLPVGGLETVVIDLAHGLHSSGTEVHVGCLCSLGRDPASLDGMPLWEGHATGLERSVNVRTLTALCRTIRRQGIDVIHSHNPKPLQYAVMASFLTGRPVVHTIHGVGAKGHYDSKRHVLLSRLLLSRCGRVVGVSDAVLQRIRGPFCVPEARSVLVLNGVATSDFAAPWNGGGEIAMREKQALRTELGLASEGFIIGSVGRLCAEKDYPTLVRAFARFRNNHPHSQLVIVGGGREEERIRRAAQDCALGDAFVLPGENREVRRWLWALDVFCLSSTTEGTPMTLLEAASAGLPAVATDVGGNAEVVQHGRTGLIVPAQHIDALSAAFAELAADDSKRLQYGAAAHAFIAEHYSRDAMVTQYRELYREVSL